MAFETPIVTRGLPLFYCHPGVKQILCFELFLIIISRNISKVSVKNIREDSEKCKTIIYIDGVIVFTSDAYTWQHPDNKKTELNVETTSYTKLSSNAKCSIQNISITAYE